MILGVSSPLVHNTPEDWAKQMRQIGCQAVVFPVDYRAGEETINQYYEAAKKEELVIAEVGVWRNVLAPNENERNKAIEYAIGQLKLAEGIGANCCVNVAGTPVGPRWDGGYRENFSEETWKLTVKTIQHIIDAVKPTHTYYSIESMPWMIPSCPSEYLRLIEEVNRPQFRAHLDVVNMITSPKRYFFSDEFLEECFLKLKGMICSCHLKDVKLREEYTFQLVETCCGQGSLNLELFAELATKENPKMPMIIEHLNSDEEYLNSLKYVRNRLKM